MYRPAKMIIFFILIVTLCFFGGFIIKLNSYKETYFNEINKILDGSIETSGKISISFLDFGFRITSLHISQVSSESQYKVGKLDIHLSPRSLLFGKPEISKIILRDGEILVGNVAKFFSSKAAKLHLEGVDIVIPDYSIQTHLKHGVYEATESDISFSGEMGNGDEILYKTIINFNKKRKEYFIKLSNKDDNLKLLFSDEKKSISGNGKDLLSLLSAFTNVRFIKAPNNTTFSIQEQYEKSESAYSVKINSDVLESTIKLFKVAGKNRVEINNPHIDLSRLFVASVEDSFTVLLKLQKVLFGEVDLKFISPSIKLKDCEIKDVYFDFSDRGKISIIDNFMAKIDESLIKATAKMETKFPRHTLMTSEIQYNGTLSKGVLKLFKLEKFKDIAAFKGKQFESVFNVIMGPNMFIIDNAKIKLGEIKIDASAKYNRQMKKVKGYIKADSLAMRELTRDNIRKFFNQFSYLDTSIRLDLSNIEFSNGKISHIDLIHHSKNKNNVSDLRINSPNLTFTGKIKFDKTENILEVDIDGDTLDRNFLPSPMLLELQEQKDKDFTLIWNDKIFPEISANLTGKFNINFGNVFHSGTNEPSFGFGFSAEVRDNILKIRKFSLKKESFLLEMVANLTFNEGQNSFIASLTANNLDFGEALKKYFNVNYISGKGNIQGDISSKGTTLKQIITNLNGKLEMNSQKINLKGGNIELLSSKLPEVRSMKNLDEITRITFFNDGTTLSNLTGSSNIANGIVATSLTFTTKTTSGVMSSNFSLTNMRNSSIVRIFISINNRPVPVDINVEGTLWKPRIFFDNQTIFKTLQETK